MVGHNRRLVLTGGAGFIGSHLAEALIRRGVELTIVDNLDPFYSPDSKIANLEEIRRVGPYEFASADICVIERMREIIARARPETIVHLAARSSVRSSIENPFVYERVNVLGTLNLLELCREFKVGKFVFGSSSSVYGATSRTPFSEGEVGLRPISPYGASKLAAETFCYTYAHLFNLQVICLRFFTVYGPRQRPDLAIHKFTSLMEAEKSLPIFGDGSTGRDYTYVGDIVAGVLAALDYEPRTATGAPFEVFNLGNSSPVTLTEMLQVLERVTGRKAVRDQQPSQPGDVPITWADISKANRLLSYRPATGFEEGLKRFVVWYRAHASQGTPRAIGRAV